MKKLLVISVLILISSFFSLCDAQYLVLLNFNGTSTNGGNPYGSLLLSGSRLFGMTNGNNLFSIDTNGNGFKNVLVFNDPNGGRPTGSLIPSGKKLFGMTEVGVGINGNGNIFSIDTDGNNFKNLWNFYDTSGEEPYASLTLLGKVLFGTTEFGNPPHQYGNVFRIDTDGSNFKVLLYFNTANGSYPGCTLALSGKVLFGMTSGGGPNGDGNIFAIDTDGSNYKDLLDFNGTNGSNPGGSLIYKTGTLYGLAGGGGLYADGCVFSIDTNGNKYKDLFDFNGTNGLLPYGSLALSGKLLFGMTFAGGYIHDSGCVFQIDTDGTNYKQLFNFNGTDGANPIGDVTLSGSILYGMTQLGGTDSHGVIFKLDTNIGSSIDEITLNSKLSKIFPNPSTGIFTIALSHPADIAGSHLTVEIYNEFGQKVTIATLKPMKQVQGGQVQGDYSINMSNQLNGIYFYKVIGESGGLVGEGKVVIQK